MTNAKYIIATLAIVLVGACATPERIVLLPGPEGKPTAVTVTGTAGSTTLSEPYAQAIVGAREVVTDRVDADWVAKRYTQVISATPVSPKKFMVYFAAGSNELTAESMAVLESMKRELAALPAAEIIVIGHTDRVGTVESNDALSTKRAEFIREKLVSTGIDAARISTFGRGEREPIFPTEDEVAEPKNRRVEIKIR